jgi:hypothetical protein
MTSTVMFCLMCKHYLGDGKCEAFDSIPEEIFYGEKGHFKSVDGDKGIVFENKEESVSKKSKPGSGNRGHAGRPGKRGGSVSTKGKQ